MRILLTGARGQLATGLCQVLRGHDLVPMGHQDLDIVDVAAVHDALSRVQPDLVINPAAIRRPDQCEEAPDRAFAVNAVGARNLALACMMAGSALVQVSTDNVFDGRKTSPYLEDDAPNPVGVYGISKLAGELFVRGILERHYIVRTGPLFGGASRSGVPTNFVLRMLHQVRSAAACHVVTDQRVSPTYTLDLARKIGWLITTNAYGLYHISNAGECSWYELAQAIFEAAAINADLRPIQTAALGVRSHRLAYAVLGHGGLRRLDADDLPSWRDALSRYLDELRGSGWL